MLCDDVLNNAMKKPKISIITITYNSEKTLEDTILSVISQSYQNIEYLIIDGKSTDNTLRIVEKYKDHIDFVLSEKDNGISDAFNKGIAHATGEIIGILNSDDLLLPNAIAKIAEHYEPGIDIYRGNIYIWNDVTGAKKKEIPSMKFPVWNIFPKVAHQGTFITKAAYLQYGSYDTQFKFMMDLNLLTKLYHNKAKFKYVDADIALFRLGGLTATKIQAKADEIKKYMYTNGGTHLNFATFYYPRLFLQFLRKMADIIK